MRSSGSRARAQTLGGEGWNKMNIHHHSGWIQSGHLSAKVSATVPSTVYGALLPDQGKTQPCAWGNRGDSLWAGRHLCGKAKGYLLLGCLRHCNCAYRTNDVMLGLAPLLKSPRKGKQTFLSANDSSSIKQLSACIFLLCVWGLAGYLLFPGWIKSVKSKWETLHSPALCWQTG